MSEDTNDETAGRPRAWESATGHDAAVPEDPAQAIALPAVTPPRPGGAPRHPRHPSRRLRQPPRRPHPSSPRPRPRECR